MNKKGLTGSAKITFFLIILVFSFFFIYNIIPVSAKGGNNKGNPGSIWTTRNDCGDIKQDVNHYYIGEHVYINGANFDSGDYFWKIKGQPGGASCDPNKIVAMGNFTVDETGSFCFDAYTVQPGDCGEYQVKFGNKGDNYRVKEKVNITCENHTTKSSCEEDPKCDWCPLCQYFVRPTKVNQWLQARCVPAGTNCGWHCETGYCEATCSLDTDCKCSQDSCIGNDYYDYPVYGECVDCPISCFCEIGTNPGEPCEPTISYNDPRCVGCTKNEDCDDKNPCTTDECIDYRCVYTPKTESTPCELDDNVCTVDHCDGSGICVYLKDLNCSDSNECTKDLCNPLTGCSNPPESYGKLCGLFRDCQDDKCIDFIAHFYPDDGHDYCDGSGNCLMYSCDLEDSYCTDNDPFDGVNDLTCGAECDKDNDCEPTYCPDGCVGKDWYDYDDVPNICEAECTCTNNQCGDPIISYNDPRCTVCQDDDDCNHLDKDYCFGDLIKHDEGKCINYECSAETTTKQDCYFYEEYCDADEVWYKEGYCNDLGPVCDYKADFVSDCNNDYEFCDDNQRWEHDGFCTNGRCDSEEKVLEDCDIYNQDYCSDDYHWVHKTGTCLENEETICAVASSTGDCRDDFWCNGEERCENEGQCVPATPVDCDDSNICTIDSCDEETDQCLHTPVQIVLDPPNKKVDEPKVECEEGDWCDYKITVLTPITLSCEVGDVKWRYALDGEWKKWNTNASPVTIYFPEESNHTLEAQCIIECGESLIDSENFKVEGTVFEIPLYKKWNLISVPFVLLDDDPKVVFNKTEGIKSVWTYYNGFWYFWTKDDTPKNLEKIVPGWGYWVLTNNDTLLVIGGSLFSPATPPPSRGLVKGWNLIGYYGTEFYGTDWEEKYLDSYDSCGFYHKYGNYAYCKLNSLIDTQQGFPRWSSLIGYDNCGNHTAYWVELNICDNMHAGKGYWLEMDVEDLYAPASTCIWNKDFICSS